MNALAGRVVQVDGAARGLGREMALELGAAGARLALTGAGWSPALAATADEAGALGAEVLSLVCDVADAAACAASLSAVEQHFGRIDALATMRASGCTPFRKPPTARRSGSGKPSPRHGGRSSRRTSTAPSTWPASSRQMGKIVNICASDVTMVRRGYAPYGPSKAGLEAPRALGRRISRGPA